MSAKKYLKFLLFVAFLQLSISNIALAGDCSNPKYIEDCYDLDTGYLQKGQTLPEDQEILLKLLKSGGSEVIAAKASTTSPDASPYLVNTKDAKKALNTLTIESIYNIKDKDSFKPIFDKKDNTPKYKIFRNITDKIIEIHDKENNSSLNEKNHKIESNNDKGSLEKKLKSLENSSKYSNILAIILCLFSLAISGVAIYLSSKKNEDTNIIDNEWLKDIETDIKNRNNKINELNKKIIENTKKNDIFLLKTQFQEKLSYLRNELNNSQNMNTTSIHNKNIKEEEQKTNNTVVNTSTKSESTSKYKLEQIIEDFNNLKILHFNNIYNPQNITVSNKDDVIYGFSPIFINSENADYIIVKKDNNEYYLFKTRISNIKYNAEISNIFLLPSLAPKHKNYSEWTIEKPAIVIYNGLNYILKERGEILLKYE